MGKKGLSDKVRSRQKSKTKTAPNPFEIKVNKIKHSVVNKKLQKWEKGLPGVARSKAVKKRKDTLLRELHHMKKSNTLLDRRIGEGDANLTADEKMVQRFALEKKKQMRKSDFNLNEEEEVLTHYGQSLAENLQDTVGSESEDDDAGGNFKTGELQFGGFAKDGQESSWKDKMKEVIADSKKQKFERQAEKEKTLETTNELDKSWKSLASTFKPVRDTAAVKKKASSYMMLFHNLVLEQKSAGASDKLKTEEERAKEEADRLRQLEAERVARMKGNTKTTASSHRSADDLNDGFSLDKSVVQRVSFSERVGPSSGDDDDKEGEDDAKQDNEDVDDEAAEQKDGDGSDDNEDDDDDKSDDDGSESDNFSDLESEEEEEEAESDDDESSGEDDQTAAVEKVSGKTSVKSILKKTKVPDNKKTEKPPKDVLPFVYKAPGSYEELESLLHGHSAEEQATILSRLRKCHHPSLAEGNKDKLEKIQLYVLQYFGQLVKQHPIDTKLVNHVTVCLWEMTQTFQASTAAALQKIIVDRQREFASLSQKKGGKGTFVGIDTLMYLSLIDSLFPASDFRHPVTTPAIHFITHMLSECQVRNCRDVASGLFLCSLALKFVSLSKRYIPEVVTFLHGLLCMGADKSGIKDLQLFPPFRLASKAADLLLLQDHCSTQFGKWSISDILNSDPASKDNDDFRYDAVNMCVDLLSECMELWENLPCVDTIMKPLKIPLSLLPTSLYPAQLRTKITLLEEKLETSKTKKLKLMQQPSKKPVPLKLFEPQIEEFWSGKRKKGGPNREANERQRLTHKYKREMKAAIREVKRDNEVLARHQLDSVMQKDAERKRKTKELMNSLASQEGDYKAMTKKMKK